MIDKIFVRLFLIGLIFFLTSGCNGQTKEENVLNEKTKKSLEKLEKIKISQEISLSYLRELEEAYEKKWLLSTSELSLLLNIPSKNIEEYQKTFQDAGFTFIKCGTREQKQESAWLITKNKNDKSCEKISN